MRTIVVAVFVIAALAASSARAQQRLRTPDASPAAAVEQTVGLTAIKVTYHRPAVNGRKVWGELVPYGEVWRAGANENTIVSFSSPVKVAGKPLAAGTYGLHMIPSAREWTVIVSHQAGAWGSFGYDPKEDALRVVVTPQPSETFVERLTYDFDHPTDSGTTLTLRWEQLRVPIPIAVDTPVVVMASMRAELRGVAQFSWQPWNDAARYWVDHGGNLDEAQKMVQRSIARQETFANLSTKAAVLEKRGDAKAGGDLRARAMAIASENDLNLLGYTLLGQKKIDEAIAIFQKNVAAHPTSWNVHDSLGEAYLAKGDAKAAADSYARALTLVKNDEPNKKRIEQTLQRLKNK
jgi:predicted negative regulator of RcsB-dependent stress response